MAHSTQPRRNVVPKPLVFINVTNPGAPPKARVPGEAKENTIISSYFNEHANGRKPHAVGDDTRLLTWVKRAIEPKPPYNPISGTIQYMTQHANAERIKYVKSAQHGESSSHRGFGRHYDAYQAANNAINRLNTPGQSPGNPLEICIAAVRADPGIMERVDYENLSLPMQYAHSLEQIRSGRGDPNTEDFRCNAALLHHMVTHRIPPRHEVYTPPAGLNLRNGTSQLAAAKAVARFMRANNLQVVSVSNVPGTPAHHDRGSRLTSQRIASNKPAPDAETLRPRSQHKRPQSFLSDNSGHHDGSPQKHIRKSSLPPSATDRPGSGGTRFQPATTLHSDSPGTTYPPVLDDLFTRRTANPGTAFPPLSRIEERYADWLQAAFAEERQPTASSVIADYYASLRDFISPEMFLSDFTAQWPEITKAEAQTHFQQGKIAYDAVKHALVNNTDKDTTSVQQYVRALLQNKTVPETTTSESLIGRHLVSIFKNGEDYDNKKLRDKKAVLRFFKNKQTNPAFQIGNDFPKRWNAANLGMAEDVSKYLMFHAIPITAMKGDSAAANTVSRSASSFAPSATHQPRSRSNSESSSSSLTPYGGDHSLDRDRASGSAPRRNLLDTRAFQAPH